MEHKQQNNQLYDLLKTYFPKGSNYLILSNDLLKVNSYFMNQIYIQTSSIHKKEIWGEKSRLTTQYGKEIGWVPDQFDHIFFADTVRGEIAEALINRNNELIPEEADFLEADNLIAELKIEHLSQSNPFFLSEGETKLLWFISQFAKAPQYMIITNLTAGLSRARVLLVIDFILKSLSIGKIGRIMSPTYIIGLSPKDHDFITMLQQIGHWHILSKIDFLTSL